MKDLIDERNRKEKMQNSILKWWNVHYMTPEELEELFSLPPEDRAVIHLHYYEGYSTGEIAQMLGQRPGTVRSRLSRARERLKKLLEG